MKTRLEDLRPAVPEGRSHRYTERLIAQGLLPESRRAEVDRIMFYTPPELLTFGRLAV